MNVNVLFCMMLFTVVSSVFTLYKNSRGLGAALIYTSTPVTTEGVRVSWASTDVRK